jgi:hypothetical protein
VKIRPAVPRISLSNRQATDRGAIRRQSDPTTTDNRRSLDQVQAIAAAIAAVRAASAERRWAYARLQQTGNDWTCVLEDHKSIYVVRVDGSSGGARVTRVNRTNRTVPADESDTGP